MSDPHHLGPLLNEARQGDRAALDALLGQLRPYLHRVLKNDGVLGMPGLGESDLVQLTLLAIFRSLPKFRGKTPGEFLNWAKRICHNLQFAAWRRPKPEGPMGDAILRQLPDDEASPSGVLLQKETNQRLLAAVDRLPEFRCLVVRLRVFEELPFAAIAKRLGKTEGAVRVLWMRALVQLNQLILK